MKNIVSTLFSLFFITISGATLAQEEFLQNKEDITSLLAKELLFDSNRITNSGLQSTNQFLQNNNLVQVQQIGKYNYAAIDVRSKEADIQVNQFGDNNYTNIYRNDYKLTETVNQTGNNNFISDFSVYSEENVNTLYNQNGNNLSIYSTGSNSISKNLQINQTGNSGTVYIYNR